ncbi:sulfurtransferase TusC, partial [Pseudoalteromonas sp. MelDa3]
YGLNKHDLLIEAKALNFSQQQTLIKAQQHVVNL